jgi:probable HAF family extracellular repeat protein
MTRRHRQPSEQTIVGRVVLSTLAAAALAVLPAAPAEAATTTDLGRGWADVINDHGQVAGHFTDAAGRGRGFVWTPRRGRQDIGGLGGSSVSVSAINEQGQVAGYSTTRSGTWHAFRWSLSSGMRDLGTLGGTDSFASAMNNSGTVVGSSAVATGERHAFVWSPSSGMRDLGAGTAQAYGVNDGGQVVGSYLVERGYPSASHLFVWSRSRGLRDLGRPDVPVDGHLSLTGVINERGQVAGTYTNALDTYGAFRVTPQGRFEILAALPGNNFGQTHSINSAGMIAGIYEQLDGIHAFRWSPRSGLRDLGVTSSDWHEHGLWMVNTRGDVCGTTYSANPRGTVAVRWTPSAGMRKLGTPVGGLSGATAINAQGQVAGWSTTAGGVVHAVLWRP